MNNQIPYFGAYGYVSAPTKSINWGAFFLFILMLGGIVFVVYQLFISDEQEEKENRNENRK